MPTDFWNFHSFVSIREYTVSVNRLSDLMFGKNVKKTSRTCSSLPSSSAFISLAASALSSVSVSTAAAGCASDAVSAALSSGSESELELLLLSFLRFSCSRRLLLSFSSSSSFLLALFSSSRLALVFQPPLV